jgi:hypothetical protein
LVLSVLAEYQTEHLRTSALTTEVASRARRSPSRLPTDVIKAALMMLEAGGQIRWGGTAPSYELVRD